MPEDTNPPTTTVEAPAAETNDTTPSMSLEEALRELAKVRNEAARHRTKAKTLEDAQAAAAAAKTKAEQTAEERATAAEKRATEAQAAADTRVLTAERKAALVGKITNPDRFLRLMEDPEKYFDGGTPNVDAILKDFPEYAPKPASTVTIPGSKTAGGPATNPWVRETRNLTEQARITRENPALAQQLKDAAS